MALKEKMLALDSIEQMNLKSKEFMNRMAEYNPEYVEKLNGEVTTESQKKQVCRKSGR